MKKYFKSLTFFKKASYSPWIDVGCFESREVYFLIQMKFDLHTNRKRFRRIKIGWVNDYSSKDGMYNKIQKYNADRTSLIIKQRDEDN